MKTDPNVSTGTTLGVWTKRGLILAFYRTKEAVTERCADEASERL